MKLNPLLVLVLITFLSCNERSVQLPETTNQTILEISDVSPVYFFYNEESGEMKFNRNNLIGTTNWLVNIDKRLTLEQILPDLNDLQKKRRKDGIHKNESARNYFTCSNPDIQNLAFIDFTNITYRTESITDYLITNPFNDNTKVQVFINFKKDGAIDIGKKLMVKSSDMTNFESDLLQLSRSEALTDYLYLNFNEDLSFQDYISFKSILLEIEGTELEVSQEEFIYK
ncbi:MAG: hypothetical protein KJO41_12185 [Bacteroidia bacterium]|nr:hypothetical protein [Bacteroidia bacterium]MBT8279753.1 hypothetical protein [Bacteroidia bacterium]NNK59247.1 hypothetical protein [Flavobacteriaceae bacterium]